MRCDFFEVGTRYYFITSDPSVVN